MKIIVIAQPVMLIFLTLSLTGMSRPPTENTLSLAGTRLTSSRVHQIALENPAVSGYVRLDAAPRFERTASGEQASCCSRIEVVADRSVFIHAEGPMGRSALAFIPEQTPRNGFWRFEASALALPADGSVVTLQIRIDNALASPPRRVKLKTNTIVLPVHVHLFKSPRGGVSASYKREFIFDWLDPGAVRTEVNRIRDPVSGAIETHVIKQKQSSIIIPPDLQWQFAGTQFRLATYEIIEQRDGLERNLFSPEEAARPLGGACRSDTTFWPYHQARQSTEGIHVYFGGQIPARMLLSHTIAATCGPHTSPCVRSNDPRDFIVWQMGPATATIFMHELGHYLGLGHPGEPLNCPLGLEVDGNNVMRPGTNQLGAVDAQLERVRTLACNAARRWSLPADGC